MRSLPVWQPFFFCHVVAKLSECHQFYASTYLWGSTKSNKYTSKSLFHFLLFIHFTYALYMSLCLYVIFLIFFLSFFFYVVLVLSHIILNWITWVAHRQLNESELKSWMNLLDIYLDARRYRNEPFLRQYHLNTLVLFFF